MKRSIILAMLAITLGPTYADVIRLSEPVQSDETSETFGEPMKKMPSLVGLANVLKEPEKYTQTAFGLEASVKKVCQKKGCFFIAQQGQETIRISFKDYGFFVPTDITNRTVTLVGTLTQHEVSPEEAKHFSKDLGEKGSVKSGFTYEIVATSVRVPKS
ncbi:MAG: DUF4920 domain-containing protein [Gammaproteobacteria bacterium]